MGKNWSLSCEWRCQHPTAPPTTGAPPFSHNCTAHCTAMRPSSCTDSDITDITEHHLSSSHNCAQLLHCELHNDELLHCLRSQILVSTNCAPLFSHLQVHCTVLRLSILAQLHCLEAVYSCTIALCSAHITYIVAHHLHSSPLALSW